MADERGLEGPEDPGAIDVPDGLTPQQVKAGELARREAMRHLNFRRVLTMDEMAELKDPRPRLEKEFRLPGDSRGRNKIYMFSLDGTLRGEHLVGCLFAGECMIVQAESFEKANNLAKDGLKDTVELALEYWGENEGRLVYAAPDPGIQVEVGGGRRHDIPTQPDLASDPKMKAMLEHIIGRKPWRH